MKKNGGFQSDTITDQKRLARGEHWRMARGLLRARDKVHNAKWKVLMVAGPEPSKEIDCIRGFMPLAHITAVDKVQAYVEAAIDAGADDVACLDLEDYREIVTEEGYSKTKKILPPPFFDQFMPLDNRFDVICLDLTGPANDNLKRLISIYERLLSKRGSMIVTFSYGRDVVEMLNEEWDYSSKRKEPTMNLLGDNIPDVVAIRLWYALRSRLRYVRSVIQYSGYQKMPMVSFLLNTRSALSDHYLQNRKLRDDDFIKFVALTDTDYMLAVTDDDPTQIYSCPADRIEHLRRKLAAMKAATTRKARLESFNIQPPNDEPMLVPQEPPPIQLTGESVPMLPSPSPNNRRQPWTQDEIAYLRNASAFHLKAQSAAEHLGRTVGAVRQKAFSMGWSLDSRPYMREGSDS